MHVTVCLSQEEYVSEGLEWSFVKYQDNQSCLDLIEGGPVGVFSLLNEVPSSLCFTGLIPHTWRSKQLNEVPLPRRRVV